MIHELEVHKLELEMQNDQLRAAQEDLETSRKLYFNLYDLAPVGYCIVNEKGFILKANLTAADLLSKARSGLINQLVTHFIEYQIDITVRRQTERELKRKADELEETNTALKVLLKRREQDKDEIEENIFANYHYPPFSKKLSDKLMHLTPTEIYVAELIKQGKSNKEIAQILNCSFHTIARHRDNIRIYSPDGIGIKRDILKNSWPIHR